MRHADVTGLILAGGQGSRMGGRDKGLVEWRGRPLVRHALDRLSPQVGVLLVSANRNGGAYQALGHPVVADARPGYAGPLAGLAAGLAAATTDWVAAVPCDSPLLPSDLVARLHDAAKRADAAVAVARTPDGLQPVFCLAHRRVLPSLDAFLAGGGHRVRHWLDSQAWVAVPFDDQPEAFRNFNTEADLETPAPDAAEGAPATPNISPEHRPGKHPKDKR